VRQSTGQSRSVLFWWEQILSRANDEVSYFGNFFMRDAPPRAIFPSSSEANQKKPKQELVALHFDHGGGSILLTS